MSSLIFPYASLSGVTYEYNRWYEWSVGRQRALSGKMSTISLRAYPLVHFKYDFELLRDNNGPPNDIETLAGFINAMGGGYDTFLHTDPDFNTISPANAATLGNFGTGNGTTLTFQLLAQYQNSGGPGGNEIIQNLNGTPILYANGTAISSANYSIGATGIVTFGSGHAPASGAALTWSGSFYYRCRFDEDHYEFRKEFNHVWSVESITFTSVSL